MSKKRYGTRYLAAAARIPVAANGIVSTRALATANQVSARCF